MPELPDARRRRFVDAYALPEYDAAPADAVARAGRLLRSGRRGRRAAEGGEQLDDGRAGARARTTQDATSPRSPVDAAQLAGLLALVDEGTISGAMAKEVFEKMFASGRAADEIVAAEGLTQIDDEAQIVALIADVLGRERRRGRRSIRGGKAATFGFLVGQVMKAAGGKANPKRVNELLKRALDEAGTRTRACYTHDLRQSTDGAVGAQAV